jgi:nitrogen fixation protein NifU and related proteins
MASADSPRGPSTDAASGATPAAGLYRDAILDHSRNPRHSGRLDRPDLSGSATNPLCGDQALVTVSLAGDAIADIRGAVRGCAIAAASCSIMTDVVLGKPLADARRLGQAFRAALDSDAGELPAELAALAPLIEVKRHRSRITCALLAWEALDKASPPAEAAAPDRT